MSDDNYFNRYKISEGFKWSFICGIVINILILIIVAVALEVFWNDIEFKK